MFFQKKKPAQSKTETSTSQAFIGPKFPFNVGTTSLGITTSNPITASQSQSFLGAQFPFTANVNHAMMAVNNPITATHSQGFSGVQFPFNTMNRTGMTTSNLNISGQGPGVAEPLDQAK